MELEEALRRVMPLPDPWKVVGAEFEEGIKSIEVQVVYGDLVAPCPQCGERAKKHDTRRRRWRHLDLCDHQTWVACDVPRVKCEEHGVIQIEVPWADAYSRFTQQFECHVIDWLQEASMNSVAKKLGISWDQAAGVQQRAVARGMERRGPISAVRIGIDETSFQKRHEYVSVVSDTQENRVLHVADGRGAASIEPFFKGLSLAQRKNLKVVALDMHAPFINIALRYVPDIEWKICFDRFHVAQIFGKAVDTTRRAENKRRMAKGDDTLKGTRYHWLKNIESLPKKLRLELVALLEASTAVAKVWSIKELARGLWHYKSRSWAVKAWSALCELADSTGIPILRKVANTIWTHMYGIINAIIHRATNASSENINSRIQALKRRANGYRNRARFRDAIYFHLGGLDLYPRPSFHTKP